MTDFTFLLAASGLPTGKSINPLLPKAHDIIWSVVPLVAILVLFWKLVLPKFQEVLTEQEDRIEGDIERTEAAWTEVEAALEKYNSQLAGARTKTAKICDEARTQGQCIIADTMTKANDGSARIVEFSEKQPIAQRERVIAEPREEMGWSPTNLTERLLGEQLSDDVHNSSMIDSFLPNPDTMTPTGK